MVNQSLLTRPRPRSRWNWVSRRLGVLLGVAALATSASATPTTAVVGGQDAANDHSPWTVSVRTSSHACGGVIYNGRTVLTAARCVDGLKPESLSIHYGTLYHSRGGTDVRVKDVVMHPHFDGWKMENDIAVIHTKSPIVKGENARSVCLPVPGSDPAANDIATLAGWGATTEGGSLPARLQTVDLPIVDRAKLRSQYDGFRDITNNMIGAGVDPGGRGAGKGDEGSPLTMNVNGAATLVGIYSWSYGNARPNYPSVFTRVSPYVKYFITDNIVRDKAFPHTPCGK